MKEVIVKPIGGISLNTSFEEQPKNTYRFAVNAVVEEDNGELGSLTTERGNVLISDLNLGGEEDYAYTVIGSQNIDGDNVLLFISNDVSGKDIISIFNGTTNTVLINETLGFNSNYKIDSVYRLRKGCERTVYFTDGLNEPRRINIDSISDYFVSSSFRIDKLSLFQIGNSKANFDYVREASGGSLSPGSYNFAIQYIDEDFNSLEFFLVSDTINIYNDDQYSSYENIGGSTSKSSFYHTSIDTNKSIELKINELDTTFPYYRVAVIKANTGIGLINEVSYTDYIKTTQNIHVYSDDSKLFEGSLAEVQQFTNYISSAKHIDTVDNMLLLANTEGPSASWGSLQKYASKINVSLSTQNRKIDSIRDDTAATERGYKSSNVHTTEVSYQFGELYAFGIVYVFEKGFTSPVFHIPGKSATSSTNMSTDNTITKVYDDKGDCVDYWSLDFQGDVLEGENVRHHRLPTRTEFNTDLYIKTASGHFTDMAFLDFSNIEIPTVFDTEKIIGYYIVQAERTEYDKVIIDSAILTPVIENNTDGYYAHHVLNNDKSPSNNSIYSKTVFALINPQFKFKNNKHTGFNIKHEGYYTVGDTYLRTNKVEDAQAGTSYNPDVHKRRSRDSDGFTLHTAIRENNLSFTKSNALSLTVDEVFYLDTLESYQLDSGTDVFNLSSDNKVGFVVLNEDVDYDVIGNKYPYILLTRDVVNQYSDFDNRAYYKCHSNMEQATNGAVVTKLVKKGDSFVSSMSYSSSVFYDIRILNTRRLKKGVWKFILGVYAIIAGAALILLSVATAGLSAAPGIAAVSFGISMLSSGIKQANIARAYTDLHEEGLKDTILDSDIQAEFDVLTSNPPESTTTDDEIQWFMDTLKDVFFESQINMGLRIESNLAVSDFLPSPSLNHVREIANSHLLDKVSIVDQDKSQGRAYLGFCRAELYEINPDYERRERQKAFFAISNTYDYCSTCIEKFPHRIWKSNQSFSEDSFDNFRVFLPNNYKDISGEGGEITDLFVMKNNIFIHTEKILWHQPQNFQERVTSEIVSFLGTGDYFNIPSRKIVDADGLSAGVEVGDKWATIKTPYGTFFLSKGEGRYYQFDGQSLKPLTDKVMNFKFREELIGSSSFISAYDREFERVLLTKYGSNPWTLSYSFKTQSWVGLHSYIPYYYFNTRSDLFSVTGLSFSVITSIWKHNIKGSYLTFYNSQQSFIVDCIAVANPLTNVTWEELSIVSKAEEYDNSLKGFKNKKITFDKVSFYTRKQYSGELEIVLKEVENYFNSGTTNLPEVEASYGENIWKVNSIRDYVIDYDNPIIKETGFLPELNASVVSFDKNWNEVELIRDKYLGIRLEFNTFTNIKLTLNYLKVNFIPSKR
tara:strand:+ start:816 stop:4898 length:4083 start_codon:yes stop_codon:yes gene_type:complete